MSDIPMEIPSARQLIARDHRRDRPIASLALAFLLCVAMLALLLVPKAPANGETASGAEQTESQLFP